MYLFIKRIFDIFLALFLLWILLPLYLLLSLFIYLQDRGNPIFKQQRVGKNGKLFNFYKFRSMPLNSPNVGSHERHKLKVTPFGKFIRRTNLDELPQFFNVLKGDMSFIGPRPCIPVQETLVILRKENGSLDCHPGLTGWAQVNSYDGMPEEKKAELDGFYAKNINFSMELSILLKTVVYFTKKPPVY